MGIHYRKSVAIVDVKSLRHNVSEAKKRLPQDAQLVGVVKANAYGHGSVMVSRVLSSSGIKKLAVATLEEGIELREKGIRDDIMVLGGLFGTSIITFKEWGLKPVIHNKSEFDAVLDDLKDRDAQWFVHLKFDIGMGRLGFFSQDVADICKKIRYFPGLKIESILTHLALADGSDQQLTLSQKNLLSEISSAFVQLGIEAKSHFANSAALCDDLVAPGQWARPGIMLYGAYPSERFANQSFLKPVMSFKSALIDIKSFPAGSGISYGHTFVTKRESLIGVVSVGYADGYPRSLSNKGEVFIKGQRVPVVGRVCMDLTMVDLTEASNIQIGDEVELWGENISVDAVAQKAGTISYELLCGVSARVPRVYVNV